MLDEQQGERWKRFGIVESEEEIEDEFIEDYDDEEDVEEMGDRMESMFDGKL